MHKQLSNKDIYGYKIIQVYIFSEDRCLCEQKGKNIYKQVLQIPFVEKSKLSRLIPLSKSSWRENVRL